MTNNHPFKSACADWRSCMSRNLVGADGYRPAVRAGGWEWSRRNEADWPMRMKPEQQERSNQTFTAPFLRQCAAELT